MSQHVAFSSREENRNFNDPTKTRPAGCHLTNATDVSEKTAGRSVKEAYLALALGACNQLGIWNRTMHSFNTVNSSNNPHCIFNTRNSILTVDIDATGMNRTLTSFSWTNPWWQINPWTWWQTFCYLKTRAATKFPKKPTERKKIKNKHSHFV